MNKITEQIKALVDKIKKINFKEIKLNDVKIDKELFVKIKDAFLREKKYAAVTGILVVFAVVLAIGISGDKKRNSQIQPETEVSVDNFQFSEEFENDKNEDITGLLTKYYDAYVNGDVDTLGSIAYPMSDNEKSYIKVLSNYYEKVTNINYYSKPGIKTGSYFVSASIEIKFKDVDTTALTLDFFYVETDDGKLYINNLYSIYNLNFMENSCDPDVYAVVQKYMAQEDFIKLQQEVQTKFNEAIASDEKLATMIETTLNTAIRDWQASITANQVADTQEEQPQKETPQEEQPEQPQEETPQEEQPQEEQPEQPQEQQPQQPQEQQPQAPATTTYKTLDVVNVRDRASKEGALIGVYGEGALLNKTGEDGEWTIIDFNGTPGYVKTEFLEPVVQ